MTIDTEDLINSIKESFERMTYIKPDEIPNIDLYMDQVTTFLDDRLKTTARVKTDEKLITKTMINNYAKNEVIPAPIRKKYSKDHVLLLIMVYYFKSMLQINDIKDLLDPISQAECLKKSDFGIEEIYKEIFDSKVEQLKEISDDVVKKYESSMKTFEGAPEDMKEYLKIYSFICELGCDVFVKKLLIEKIVDSLRDHKAEPQQNKYDVMPEKKPHKEKQSK